jgi:hypothetical protein
MAKRRYELDTRVLAVFFFAAMPFVAVGSFIVVNQARNQLRESVGTSLEQRALQTKLALEQFMAEQVLLLRTLALEPEVQKALSEPARAATADETRQLEQAWAGGTDPRLRAAILDTPLAGRLRPVALVRPTLKQVQVVDTSGRVIASSGHGGRLFHGETAWFKDLSTQEGDPEIHIGELYRPRGSTLTLFEVAYPVRSPEDVWIGAIRAVVDGSDLYTVLAPVRIGRTGHASLLRSTDGLVLASDESERILQEPMPGFESLRNAVEGFPLGESGQQLFGRAGQRRGYWTIPEVRRTDEAGRDILVEPARIVGFSPVDQIPDVRWLVTVEQDLSEALAPIDSVTRYLWIHFIGVFATVILLALYFSFKLEKPVMEEDLHLHEEHVPAGMRKPAAE